MTVAMLHQNNETTLICYKLSFSLLHPGLCLVRRSIVFTCFPMPKVSRLRQLGAIRAQPCATFVVAIAVMGAFCDLPLFIFYSVEVATVYSNNQLCFNNVFLFSAKAEAYKDDGNLEYKKKHFKFAIAAYTEGIKAKCDDDKLNAVLYTNRATAQFCLGEVCKCLVDLLHCIIMYIVITFFLGDAAP